MSGASLEHPDYLPVEQGPAAAAAARPTVSVGYADNATGLSPWGGSANTTFIGEPLCCATHGPDNGSPGYDAGAIEVANVTRSAVTVSGVSVAFGGGSSPSHFAIWNGGLPGVLTPGRRLVMTMNNSRRRMERQSATIDERAMAALRPRWPFLHGHSRRRPCDVPTSGRRR